MISPVNHFFDKWLTLMERAFLKLSSDEFYELEQKIIREIASHSSPQKAKHSLMRRD